MENRWFESGIVSPVTPVLYNLEIKTNTEVLRKRISFRRFEMRDRMFYLNGKPIYLRGNAINPPEEGYLSPWKEVRSSLVIMSVL